MCPRPQCRCDHSTTLSLCSSSTTIHGLDRLDRRGTASDGKPRGPIASRSRWSDPSGPCLDRTPTSFYTQARVERLGNCTRSVSLFYVPGQSLINPTPLLLYLVGWARMKPPPPPQSNFLSRFYPNILSSSCKGSRRTFFLRIQLLSTSTTPIFLLFLRRSRMHSNSFDYFCSILPIKARQQIPSSLRLGGSPHSLSLSTHNPFDFQIQDNLVVGILFPTHFASMQRASPPHSLAFSRLSLSRISSCKPTLYKAASLCTSPFLSPHARPGRGTNLPLQQADGNTSETGSSRGKSREGNQPPFF